MKTIEADIDDLQRQFREALMPPTAFPITLDEATDGDLLIRCRLSAQVLECHTKTLPDESWTLLHSACVESVTDDVEMTAAFRGCIVETASDTQLPAA